MFSLVVGLSVGLVVGLILGLVAGLTLGLVAGLVAGFAQMFVGMQADLTVTTEPQIALARDRSTYWTLGLVFGPAFGLVAGLAFWLAGELAVGLSFGLVVGLLAGFMIPILYTAWAGFLFARCWLALRRRLPWQLMSFLADAHQHRGVLRQAGAVYEFRHVDLQRRLATRPAA
jgi:hypothetical protein